MLARLAPVAALAACALSSGACATAHARAIGPPLETPAPPPRVVPSARPPLEGQPIVTAPVGEVQASAPPPERIPAATNKPAEAPPPVPPAAAPPAAARPGPETPEALTLQTTANPAAAEQRTRVSLANATRDLGRIDVRTLSADAKAQYVIARRFITQASDALNAKNFEFAQQLADKAATLAALLQRR